MKRHPGRIPVPHQVAAPGNHKGPLGPHYRPGVHDPDNLFLPKERDIADWLLARDPALCVHPRVRDPAKKEKSPDAMIRCDPDDDGTPTEFKTPDGSGDSRALKDKMSDSMMQLLPHGNGDIVIDGRPTTVSEAEARRACVRFVGQRRHHDRPLPRKIDIILTGGRVVSWRRDERE